MHQYDFNDAPEILNPNEPHMALLFLVDTSSSMAGEPIDELNKGLNRFKEQVCKDEKTRGILDVASIQFDSNWSVTQDWVPVECMGKAEFQADGCTYMAGALDKAIEMVAERSRFYGRSGTQPYKPWIVLISDGAPFDPVDELAVKVNEMVEKNKLAFWSLAVPGADMDVLRRLSGRRVLKLADYDFSQFFDWVNKSMRSVSVSSPGEKPKGVELPKNVTIDDLM